MLNKVILIGHLGADPEARTMNSGGEVVNFSVATGERWTDKDGNKQERTDWHRVVIFDPQIVDVSKKYLRKGSRVYVEGQIQTRKWTDQSGADRYTTEIVLQRFRSILRLLDRSQGDSTEPRGASTYDYASSDQGSQAQRPQPAAFDTDLDDDVPF